MIPTHTIRPLRSYPHLSVITLCISAAGNFPCVSVCVSMCGSWSSEHWEVFCTSQLLLCVFQQQVIFPVCLSVCLCGNWTSEHWEVFRISLLVLYIFLQQVLTFRVCLCICVWQLVIRALRSFPHLSLSTVCISAAGNFTCASVCLCVAVGLVSAFRCCERWQQKRWRRWWL